MALILAGVEQGDEVILPAQTFVATGLAVLYCGAKPVFADIGMDGNISVDSVSSKITEKTRAIIAVAWGGLSPDLKSLSEYKITLISDNAHALGAEVQYEDFSCFSFQSIKQLTTGDGGLIVCNNDLLRGVHDFIARQMRWFGINREGHLPDETGERKYNLINIGYKYHMNDVAAAIGLGNLEGFTLREIYRSELAKYYDEHLPEYKTYRKDSTNWLYTILVERRNDFIRAMKGRDVPTSVVHVGIDRNEIFGGLQDLPMQRYWDANHVCLPIHSKMTFEDCYKVTEAVKAGW